MTADRTDTQHAKQNYVWLVLGAVFATLAHSACWAAPAPEHWQATSTTAIAITGDITFSPDRITFANGVPMPVAFIKKLPGFQDGDDKVNADLYQVITPADPVLNVGNHLCGAPATFIVIWQPEIIGADIAPRTMAVSSGKIPPNSDREKEVCSTFGYEAASKP